MKIWAVSKDPGGTANLLPVVKFLRQKGVEVLYFATGKAIEILTRAKQDFFPCHSPTEILGKYLLPRVLVTGMCSHGTLGRDIALSMRLNKVPTVALQDFWGARLWTDWAESCYWPDFICVNDEVGAKIVQQAWPQYPVESIKVFGYPALDRYAGYNVQADSAWARLVLGLVEPKPIVFYAGQVKKSGEILGEVVEVLNELKEDVYFIPRAHPRMKDDAPEEVEKWNQALANFRGGTLVADSSVCDTQSLIAASTVVLSVFVTALVEAAVFRKKNISILYPEVGMKRFYEESGGGMKEFPLVELGCSAKVENREEFKILLYTALHGDLGLQEFQEQHFQVDGRNAERVADFILGL